MNLKEYAGAGKLRTFLAGEPGSRKTGTLPTFYRGRAGQVVKAPQNIHILACDAGGAGTLKELATLSHPEFGSLDWLNDVSIINLEPQISGVVERNPAGTSTKPVVYPAIAQALYSLRDREDVEVLWISGAGDLFMGLKREIRACYGDGPDDVMNMNRWDRLSNQFDNIRAMAHALTAHVIWEFQVFRMEMAGQGQVKIEDEFLLQGKQFYVHPGACEQAVRIELQPAAPGQRPKPMFNMRPEWTCRKTTRREACFEPIEPADWSVLVSKRFGKEALAVPK